ARHPRHRRGAVVLVLPLRVLRGLGRVSGLRKRLPGLRRRGAVGGPAGAGPSRARSLGGRRLYGHPHADEDVAVPPRRLSPDGKRPKPSVLPNRTSGHSFRTRPTESTIRATGARRGMTPALTKGRIFRSCRFGWCIRSTETKEPGVLQRTTSGESKRARHTDPGVSQSAARMGSSWPFIVCE